MGPPPKSTDRNGTVARRHGKPSSWRCRLVFREVDVVEVKEMLRLWVRGHGYKAIARLTQIDRKTVRRYIEAAQRAGLRRDGGESQITDGLVGEGIVVVRPARPGTHGLAWEH